MKDQYPRTALFSLLSLALAAGLCAQPDTWHQKANFAEGPTAEPSARYGAVGFSIGTKGYIGTGNDGSLKRDFWEYDPVGDSWSQKADFGGSAREYATGFSVGSLGYMGTGYDGSYQKDFWAYDPGTNSWSPIADLGGNERSRAVGLAIGSQGYVGTGFDGGHLDDFWEYDPGTDAWTQRADFGGTARSFAVGFGIGAVGYIGTGNDGANKKDFWEYDPANDTWTQKASFGGSSRNGAAGYAAGGKGYIGTGYGGGNYLADFWEYDPANDTWTQKAGLGSSRSGAVAFGIGATGYLGTGWNGDVMSDVRSYDASLNAWSEVATFEGLARGYTFGFSIGTKGYVGGGWNGTMKKDFWEYDPATDAWTQKADFGGAARSSAVGFSIGSKGYAGTGWTGSYRKDFWEYDPAMNTWTQKADLGGAARFSAVGFSVDGMGYITTGYSGSYLKDCWEYDPANDTWTQVADFGGLARYDAVAFTVGSKGYVGTGTVGSVRRDFWEYDPSSDTWTQVANFGGTARAGALAFGLDSKGYAGTGNDGSNKKDFWEYDPATNTWTQRSNFGGTARASGVGFAIGNRGYAGTGRDGSMRNDFWAYEPYSCTGDRVVVSVTTDNDPTEITWEITDATNVVIASGGFTAAQANMTVVDTICLNMLPVAAWYGFRLLDSNGDGITNGGWELRTPDGKLIMRDAFDVASGSSPMVPGHTPSYGAYHTFALPIGPVDIHPDECEIWDNQADNKVYAVKQGGSNYLGQTLNYQFEFINPDSGRVRRTKKPRNYVLWSELTNPDLVAGVKYYARVRTDKSGPLTDAHWGAGCEMSMGAPTACTGLIDDPNNQYYSCGVGVERRFRPNSRIFAWPVYGATKYKFRIFNLGEGYDQEFISNNYKLELSWPANVAPKLRNGYTYQVQVSALVNGVWTAYCASCPVTINNNPSGHLVEVFGDATLWPNPARDGQVNLHIDGVTGDVQHITVDVKDIYGQHVYGQEFGNTGDRFNMVLDLPGDIATGVYLVNITINGEVTTKRLSIVR